MTKTTSRSYLDPCGQRELQRAFSAWSAWARFRNDRRRNKRYTYGRQWDDMICVDGRIIPEEQYIREQGNIPLKNNLIRRLVRNVLGVFRNNWTQPVALARDKEEKPLADILNRLLDCNSHLNRLEELYARTLEEFLISGFAVHRKWFGTRNGRSDCWTDCVQPDCFFLDSDMSDFRGWDASCVGEIHDLTLSELLCRFAPTPEIRNDLLHIYQVDENEKPNLSFGAESDATESFFTPFHRSKCRVIEIWTRRQQSVWRCHDPLHGEVFICTDADKPRLVDEINRLRRNKELSADPITAHKTIDEIWHFHYLTPTGHILC